MKKTFSFCKDLNYKKDSNILYEAGFAGRMIELEIIIESDNYNLSQIKSLMSYYAKAVDYFMQIQSENFIFFNNKIKGLLLKPRVNKLLNQNNNSKTNDDFYVKNFNKNLTLKKKNFYLNKHLSLNNQQRQVRDIFEFASNKILQKFDLHKNSLKEQEKNFQQKLQKRQTRSKQSEQNLSPQDKSLLNNSMEQDQLKNFFQEKKQQEKQNETTNDIQRKQILKKQKFLQVN